MDRDQIFHRDPDILGGTPVLLASGLQPRLSQEHVIRREAPDSPLR